MSRLLALLIFSLFLTDSFSKTNLSDTFSPKILGDTLFLNVPDTVRICENTVDSVEIRATTSAGNFVVDWFPKTDIQVFDNGLRVKILPKTSRIYTASISTPAGVLTAEVFFQVDSLPANFFVSPDDTLICAGGTAQISAGGFSSLDFPKLKFEWTGSDIQSSKTNSFILAKPEGSATYSVKITNGGCQLENAASTKVEVISVEIVCDPDTMMIEPGEKITFSAVLKPASVKPSDFKFEWFEGNKTVGTGLSHTPETSRNFEKSIDITFRVVANGLGCNLGEDKILTIVNPEVIAPNAFTPNGDMVNDSFGLIPLRGKSTQLSLQVFSRWGEIIFESDEPNARWDGTNLNGYDMPMDTYFFIAKWQRKDGALQPPIKGDVTLLR